MEAIREKTASGSCYFYILQVENSEYGKSLKFSLFFSSWRWQSQTAFQWGIFAFPTMEKPGKRDMYLNSFCFLIAGALSQQMGEQNISPYPSFSLLVL